MHASSTGVGQHRGGFVHKHLASQRCSRLRCSARRALVVCSDFQYGTSLAALERVIKTINTLVSKTSKAPSSSTQHTTKVLTCRTTVKSSASVGTTVADTAAKHQMPETNTAALLKPAHPLLPGSLHQYITLPVDDYVLLDPSMVTRREDDTFSIRLPFKQITGMDLHPVVILAVEPQQDAPAVRFVVQEIKLGQPELDSMFDVSVATELRAVTGGGWRMGNAREWVGANTSPTDDDGDVVQGDDDDDDKEGGNGHAVLMQAASQAWIGQQRIETKVSLDLRAQVRGALAAIPAPLLSTVTGLVFRTLITAMAPSMLQLLVNDYARWAVGAPRSNLNQKATGPGRGGAGAGGAGAGAGTIGAGTIGAGTIGAGTIDVVGADASGAGATPPKALVGGNGGAGGDVNVGGDNGSVSIHKKSTSTVDVDRTVVAAAHTTKDI